MRWVVEEARYCRCENDHQAGNYRIKPAIAHRPLETCKVCQEGICLDEYKQTNAAMHPPNSLCAGSSAHLQGASLHRDICTIATLVIIAQPSAVIWRDQPDSCDQRNLMDQLVEADHHEE